MTRDQLRSALWSEDTFVDFEHGVNTAIKKLRQALGDSYDKPKFIETLPKTGYRFLVPVEWVTNLNEKVPPKPLAANRLVRAKAPSPKTTYRPIFVASAILLACAAAAYLLYRSPFLNTKRLDPSLILAVTSVGEKYGPSLSPDGRQLAYAWNGGSGSHFSIYVKVIGNEESLRLTHQEAIDFNPVWSSDGRYIAFCRIQKGQTGIYLVSALGGSERKIRNTHWKEREFYEVFWYFGRLSWSPDGKTVDPSVGLQQQPQDLQRNLLYPDRRHSREPELAARQIDFELVKACAHRGGTRRSQSRDSLSGGNCTSNIAGGSCTRLWRLLPPRW